jgi:tRNA nucleotidyltransferase (CCA-adding enzyme)
MYALQAIVHSNELSALSAERIWQELARGFTASKPMRMFQVLLDADAARALLPSKLVSNLAKEEYREQLITHLHASGNRLEDRCAVTFMHLSASEIRSWADCVKMPNEVRDFSEIFSELNLLLERALCNPGAAYQPVDVLAWFNRADVWRKPERAEKLIALASVLHFHVERSSSALAAAQAVNSQTVIESLSEAERQQGECIRSAIDAARLQAVESVTAT